ncbi:hypothetical protein Avbf_18026, partial [Armadillidium vulgare]
MRLMLVGSYAHIVITYQIQLTLTSTFDDMRCTLLRLLEKNLTKAICKLHV